MKYNKVKQKLAHWDYTKCMERDHGTAHERTTLLQTNESHGSNKPETT